MNAVVAKPREWYIESLALNDALSNRHVSKKSLPWFQERYRFFELIIEEKIHCMPGVLDRICQKGAWLSRRQFFQGVVEFFLKVAQLRVAGRLWPIYRPATIHSDLCSAQLVATQRGPAASMEGHLLERRERRTSLPPGVPRTLTSTGKGKR
uniref:Uncharacterized protein n=1 Tax=Trichuris muris TaxID=70415 RepID=A0A5S6QDW8_TRIMR